MNFPAFIVELCSLVPGDTAAASSLVFLGYTLACFVAPPLFGAIGDALGLQTAMLIALSLLLPLIAVCLKLHSEPHTA
jgi:predicted MFS family arabinose efflux permease